MSFELYRHEAAQVLEGLSTLLYFERDEAQEKARRHASELRQSLELYSGNGSVESLTLDTIYAPFAIEALRFSVRAKLPPCSGRTQIPADLQPLVDQANATLHRIIAETSPQAAQPLLISAEQ